MNRSFPIGTFLLVGLCNTPAGFATDDPRYPAYDFKPYVTYQNPELISPKTSTSATPSVDTATQKTPTDNDKYPAAYFRPSVIYQNPDYIKK